MHESGADESSGDELEAAIVSVFREVLGQPHAGAGDDYFQLGGDSLGAVRIVGRLRRDLGIQVRITDLALAPTPAQLASTLRPRLRTE